MINLIFFDVNLVQKLRGNQNINVKKVYNAYINIKYLIKSKVF